MWKSYGRVEELVFFAGLKEQYETLIHHYVQVNHIDLLDAFSLSLSAAGISVCCWLQTTPADSISLLWWLSHQLTWSAVRRNCEGIVFEILGTIEPAARGCKEGIGNSSKTKHISRAPGAVILVDSLCIWLILDFRLGLWEWLYL